MAPDAPQTTPPNDERPSDKPSVDGVLSPFQRWADGKPVLIYGTLIGGALVLLLLLMVVWLATRDGGSKVTLCLDTSVAGAQSAITEGGVRRVDVLIDSEDPMEGLTAIQLELQDGECRKLPEGADNRDSLLQVLGLIELYNQEGDGNIRVEYQREPIPPNLLATSTPVVTITPSAAASPPPSTPLPVLSTATATATATPSPTATPSSSPVMTASPTHTPTERPAPTSAATRPPQSIPTP